MIARVHITKETFVWIAVLVCVLVLAFWLKSIAQGNEMIRALVATFGYTGIFTVSLISGFNVAVPIPTISFLPLFLESGLNFWMTILMITLGMTMADMIAYSLGKAGHELVRPKREIRILKRLEALEGRSRLAATGMVFLFASFVPFPNEVLVVPLGLMGFPAHLLLLPLFLGNAAFNTLSAIGIANLSSLFSL